MNKNLIMFGTIFAAILLGIAITYYARGYRYNPQNGQVAEHGILVLKSHPDPAEIYLNGELETVTNATINLVPDTYDLEVRKEGFHSWQKRLSIKKEEVTEASAHLFRTAPNLSAITFSEAVNPVVSDDYTKMAYAVMPDPTQTDKEGLWIIETVNLPIGFSRDPRRVTNGDLTNANWEFSPDGREILLSIGQSAYLLNSGEYTNQTQRVNISSQLEQIKLEWDEQRHLALTEQLKLLPDELNKLLQQNATDIFFSPDEDLVLYRATADFTIEPDLIPPLPGASTQKQERDVKADGVYIYDIKDDRNFLIEQDSGNISIGNNIESNVTQSLSWFPTSRHLVHAQKDKIVIMDYDGTNRVTVYQGPYTAPHAYPSVGIDRLIILTDLGASSNPTNLYTLGIK